jgi:hypothetical protein
VVSNSSLYQHELFSCVVILLSGDTLSVGVGGAGLCWREWNRPE